MKKIVKMLLAALMIISVTSCSAKVEDLSKYNLNYISNDGLNHLTYDNVEDMYELADYVVIASPIDTCDNAVQHWRDWNDQETENFDDISFVYSFSERKFKVQKVLKGANEKLKEITVCENLVIDGDNVKITDGEYISKANNKYLLFLRESNDEEGLYFTNYYQGKYDLNSDNNEKNDHVDKELFKQVKELYKDQFK